MKLVSQTSVKVATQDLFDVLPVYHSFGNIVGGVYWKPIFHVLEGEFEIFLVNAQHMKAVPGRKTDVKDAEWIADLLQHGLRDPPASFPRVEQQAVRDLTRTRMRLIQERTRLVNRTQKVLEDANLKLSVRREALRDIPVTDRRN